VDEPLKRRLIGATVLVSLAIIFLPMLLSHKPVARHQGKMPPIPQEPKRDFDPGLLQEATPEQPKPVAAKAAPEKPVAQSRPAAPETAPKPVPRLKPRAAAPPHIPDPGKKPAAPVAKGSPQAWVIRVGSFASLASAEKLVKKLRKAGFESIAALADAHLRAICAHEARDFDFALPEPVDDAPLEAMRAPMVIIGRNLYSLDEAGPVILPVPDGCRFWTGRVA